MPGDQFNTDLAVRAYQMLYFETHPTSECYRRVWQPIDEALHALARDGPANLTCLNSRAYTTAANEDPRHIDIHVVGPHQDLLFLGTASTREAAIEDWWNQISSAAALIGYPPAQLAWGGAGLLRRDFCGSILPVDAQELTPDHLEKAARLALRRFGSLGGLPTRWLDDSKSLTIYSELYDQAAQSACPISEDDRRKIILREYRMS